MGLDFAGGTEVEVRFPGNVGPEQVRKAAEEAGFKEPVVQALGEKGEHAYLIRIAGSSKASNTSDLAMRDVEARLEPKLHALDGDQASLEPRIRRVDYVGPNVGAELRNRGVMAVLYAMGAILLYVFLRFDARFAPGGILALVHDVVVMLGYFLITRHEFNLVSVSALLTLVGYSTNDKIVVYDRIRENLGRHRGEGLPAIINRSINETLSRTVLTSGVTALSLVGLLLFGVGAIWDFAAAMLVGIITATYSSIFIAAPATLWFEEQVGRRRLGQARATN
jgi:preprotein translocase subunit SecF